MRKLAGKELVTKRSVGQPRKFKTAEDLKNKIDDYFNSITYTKVHEIFNNMGQQLTTNEYATPPTVIGMCEYLDISRDTLAEYMKKSEYTDIIKKAKGKMERYLEEQLQRKEQVTGTIFALKNHYQWQDKSEVVSDNNINVTIKYAK